MMQRADVPLSRFSRFRTSDVDQARDEVARIFCPHRLAPLHPQSQLDACHHTVDLGGFTLNYVQYGADVQIEPGQLGSFFLLQIPIAGAAQIKTGATQVDASPGMASLISPTRDVTMQWSGACQKLLVQIPTGQVERILQAQLGRRIQAPIVFDPAVPVRSGAGLRLARLVHTLQEDADSDDPLFTRHGAGPQMREMLVTALLRALPHNHSATILAPAPSIAPRHVRRAEEYMRAHAERAITVSEIAAAAGVSIRSLQEGFSRFRDTTPLEALRNIRLQSAAAALAAAEPGETVTSVAMRLGFNHLGRFSISYRERFHESPSETLRRSQDRLD